MAISLTFVTAVSNWDVLHQHLATSACLRAGRHPWHLQYNAGSAAEVLNRHLSPPAPSATQWVVWVHQDVVLPPGWDLQFAAAVDEAESRLGALAVIGAYGLTGSGPQARPVGHVLDRGTLLHPPTRMPHLIDSLDELLFAVRADSGLQLDAGLGFDFYATDLVLQAQQRGLQAAVVDAYCEHWSQTPQLPPFAAALLDRVAASGSHFEVKWAHRLPITTPIVHLENPGDTSRLVEHWRRPDGAAPDLPA